MTKTKGITNVATFSIMDWRNYFFCGNGVKPNERAYALQKCPRSFSNELKYIQLDKGKKPPITDPLNYYEPINLYLFGAGIVSAGRGTRFGDPTSPWTDVYVENRRSTDKSLAYSYVFEFATKIDQVDHSKDPLQQVQFGDEFYLRVLSDTGKFIYLESNQVTMDSVNSNPCLSAQQQSAKYVGTYKWKIVPYSG